MLWNKLLSEWSDLTPWWKGLFISSCLAPLLSIAGGLTFRTEVWPQGHWMNFLIETPVFSILSFAYFVYYFLQIPILIALAFPVVLLIILESKYLLLLVWAFFYLLMIPYTRTFFNLA